MSVLKTEWTIYPSHRAHADDIRQVLGEAKEILIPTKGNKDVRDSLVENEHNIKLALLRVSFTTALETETHSSQRRSWSGNYASL